MRFDLAFETQSSYKEWFKKCWFADSNCSTEKYGKLCALRQNQTKRLAEISAEEEVLNLPFCYLKLSKLSIQS